jgi:hypothetical protein
MSNQSATKSQNQILIAAIVVMIIILAVILWIQSGDAMILIWGVIAAIVITIIFAFLMHWR